MSENSVFLKDESATRWFGGVLAEAFPGKGLITMSGELGSGKTTLSRGILLACGHKGAVKSPTYTIVEPYELENRSIIHFDLYRLEDPEELEYLGFRAYFEECTLCLIEWPEKGQGLLPPADLKITLQIKHPGRQLIWEAHTDFGRQISQRISRVCREEVRTGHN